MAAITTATEETLKSATAEARLLEIFTYLQKAESDNVKNPNSRDYVQGSFNANTLTFTGNFNLPIGQLIDASGNIVISATNYGYCCITPTTHTSQEIATYTTTRLRISYTLPRNCCTSPRILIKMPNLSTIPFRNLPIPPLMQKIENDV